MAWRVNAVVVAAVALNTLVAILTLGHNVPIGDDWSFVEDIRRYFDNELDLSFLLRQHNEHRILFPRLFMLLIVRLSDWNLRHLMLSSFGAACLVYLLLCLAHRRDTVNLSPAARTHLDCLLAVFVFSIGQYHNWLWGWQITICMNVLSVAAGFHFLFRTERRAWTMVCAGASGVVASFSFANGLMFWPISLVFLMMQRVRRSHLVFWLTLMTTTATVYLHDYQTPAQHPDLWYGPTHPLQFVSYLVTFIGGPLIYLTAGTKLLCGIAGLALLVYWLHAVRATPRILMEPGLHFWLACGTYAIVSGAITALGRAGLGAAQAAESRYLTIANLYWIMLIGLFSYLIERDLIRPHRRLVLGYRALWFCVLLAMVGSTVSLYRTWPSQELARVIEELRKDTSDESAIATVSKDVRLVEKSKPYLKERGLSYAAH